MFQIKTHKNNNKCHVVTSDPGNKILVLPGDFNLQHKKPVQWYLKRIMDIFVSFLALIFFSPLLLFTMIIIKIDSKGPVIFKQKRIGYLGKEFNIYKFRSMVVDAEDKLKDLISKNETNHKMFKMFNDPRVTRVGKFIRKFSIDEMPQFINVIKGDMSLVGFRPPLPQEVSHYNKSDMFRFSTMPGITGIWQISGRSDIKDFETVIRLETDYIKDWNLLLDLILLLKTIPVVLSTKGAA